MKDTAKYEEAAICSKFWLLYLPNSYKTRMDIQKSAYVLDVFPGLYIFEALLPLKTQYVT